MKRCSRHPCFVCRPSVAQRIGAWAGVLLLVTAVGALLGTAAGLAARWAL